MKKCLLTLALLALGAVPIAALADDDHMMSQLTPAQRQAVQQTFQRFESQEEQLHQQMRVAILQSMTPVHRRAVGATIGDLAVSPNPDLQSAARRLDALLSPGERQRILAAHNSFRSQSMQLHDQMRNELRSELPADMQSRMTQHDNADKEKQEAMSSTQMDAGTVLLHVLSGHHMMGEHEGMMHPEGPPH
ncbi:MAG: hypothetical protein JO263_10590 [Candidatus Eremiobacteraeota bacterium]|nr:hypothetical protein [Candidatus Eremiobacteraeota bacterium]